MNQLKKEYDYIILDTPPVGLVSDALELSICWCYPFILLDKIFQKKGDDNRVRDEER
jgi:anion-transporting  ArsA/GET3 family ATPase